METKINKAQEKRDRQNTEYINSNLRRKLAEFENKYLNSVVEFEFKFRKGTIKKIQSEIAEFLAKGEEDRRSFVRNSEYRIERIEAELKMDATITMNALNYAKRSYDEKVNRLVELLVKEGFGYAHYNVEQIKNQGSELAFLISKSDKEVHARLIWVDGVEVASHFRFITTTRKK